jgi:tetratricopeptide (TPR) repeat protein
MLPRWWIALLALGAFLAFARCGKNSPPPPAEENPVGIGTDSEIDNYKAALKKDPNNLNALIGLGNLYYQTNQDRKAIENFEKALELDPSNPNVRTDMAVCLRRIGECDRAIEELKKAISSNARHPQSRYNLGVILVQDKQDAEGAIRAWEGLLENVPDYPYREQLQQEIRRLKEGVPPSPEEKR